MAKTTKKSAPKSAGRGDIINYGWNEAEKALNKVRKEVAKTIVAGAIGGIGAKVASGVKGAVVAKKVAEKAPYVKTTRGTQAKNADITLKAPGSKKSGSPKPGTKATIKKVVEPRKGAAMAGAKAAKKTANRTRTGALAAYGVGKTVETAYKVGKDQGKKEAKKKSK
jgi:hypothetical protein